MRVLLRVLLLATLFLSGCSNTGLSQKDARNLHLAMVEAGSAMKVYSSKEFVRKGFMKYTMELNEEEAVQIRESSERALAALNLITDESLEAGHPELKEMVRTKFEPGLKAFVDFTRTGSMDSEKQARTGLNLWGNWIGLNHKKIAIRQDPGYKIVPEADSSPDYRVAPGRTP